jgi:hypothetical protein
MPYTDLDANGCTGACAREGDRDDDGYVANLDILDVDVTSRYAMQRRDISSTSMCVGIMPLRYVSYGYIDLKDRERQPIRSTSQTYISDASVDRANGSGYRRCLFRPIREQGKSLKLSRPYRDYRIISAVQVPGRRSLELAVLSLGVALADIPLLHHKRVAYLERTRERRKDNEESGGGGND